MVDSPDGVARSDTFGPGDAFPKPRQMTNDPFRAPEARVADADSRPDPASRPPSVTLACRLLWATLFVGVLSLIPGVRSGLWSGLDQSPGGVAFVVGFAAVTTVFEAWLILSVGRRRGWARWLLLAYLLMGWLTTFSDFSTSIDEGMAAVIVDLASGIAEMVAAGLLFLGSDRTWFEMEADSG